MDIANELRERGTLDEEECFNQCNLRYGYASLLRKMARRYTEPVSAEFGVVAVVSR